jgi:hypothetical protein
MSYWLERLEAHLANTAFEGFEGEGVGSGISPKGSAEKHSPQNPHPHYLQNSTFEGNEGEGARGGSDTLRKSIHPRTLTLKTLKT